MHSRRALATAMQRGRCVQDAKPCVPGGGGGGKRQTDIVGLGICGLRSGLENELVILLNQRCIESGTMFAA
jgi:hypothetical protein